MKRHIIQPFRFIFLLCVTVTLFANHENATAKKVYLTQFSDTGRPVIDSVFKAVIHKSDSIYSKSKRAFSVGWLERGDAILLHFDYINPKYLDPEFPPKGFIIFNNRYFFIYSSKKPKALIEKSTNKIPFIVRKRTEIFSYKEAGEWRYLITGNTFNELTFWEYSEFDQEMLFHK